MRGGRISGYKLIFIYVPPFFLVSAAPENHQQVLKQQDEIKVKFQRSDDGTFADDACVQAGGLGNGHLLDGLGVVGSQPANTSTPI